MSKKQAGEHTQGEWKVSEPQINEEYGNQTYFSIITNKPEIIAKTYKEVGFYYPHSVQGSAEQRANAQLIADAPRLKTENTKLKEANADMLSVLEMWVDYHDGEMSEAEAALIQQTKIAINKAKGIK